MLPFLCLGMCAEQSCSCGCAGDASATNYREIKLQVAAINDELDWAKLTIESQHACMPLFQGSPSDLIGAELGLCSYSLSSQPGSGFDTLSDLGVMPVCT